MGLHQASILMFINKVVLLTAMEFLRDESIEEAESPKETPNKLAMIKSEGEKPGDSVVETKQHQLQEVKSGKWLSLLKIIGKQGEW